MKPNDLMKQRIIIAVAMFILAGVGIAAVYFVMAFRVDTSVIDNIKANQKAPNKFLEGSDEVGVKSVDDIGFVVRGELNIEIHYGKQTILMTRRCFDSPNFIQKLGEIGIEVKWKQMADKSYKYRVTYWGETVTQYDILD